MTEVRWTPQASDALQVIHDFIARDSPRYARAEVERILAAIDQLEEFPDCVPVASVRKAACERLTVSLTLAQLCPPVSASRNAA